MKKILLIPLGLAWLSAAQAADLYRVEILIFMQPAAPDLVATDGEPPFLLASEDAVDFRQTACLPAKTRNNSLPRFRSATEVRQCLDGYRRLNELNEDMIAERIRLENSGRYRILHHAAWQQPVFSPDEVRPVRLDNGQNWQADPTGLTPPLAGTVKLSREQFLQIDIALQLGAPTPEATTSSPVMHFQSNRKIRAGDLNYIDYPHIGILARATPVPSEDSP